MKNDLFLENLTDADLSGLCILSTGFRARLKEYLQVRLSSYEITLNPNNLFREFTILTDYSSESITLSDALLRSIKVANRSMRRYFLGLVIRKHGNKLAAKLDLVGCVLADDIDRFNSLIVPLEEGHIPGFPEDYVYTNERRHLLGLLYLLASLKRRKEIVRIMESKPYQDMFLHPEYTDVLETQVPMLLSADLLSYVLDNIDAIHVLKHTRLIITLVNESLDSSIRTSMAYWKFTSRLLPRFKIIPEWNVVISVIGTKLLSDIITRDNLDGYIRLVAGRSGRQDIKPIMNLIRAFPQYLGFGSRARGGELNLLDVFANLTLTDYASLREIMELMLLSEDPDTARLSRLIMSNDQDSQIQEIINKVTRFPGISVALAMFNKKVPAEIFATLSYGVCCRAIEAARCYGHHELVGHLLASSSRMREI